MNGFLKTALALAFLAAIVQPLAAAERDTTAVKKKFITGIDGGVFINTGYIFSDVPEAGLVPGAGYHIAGAPFGIGGFARLHLGEHFRFGGEGHMSDLSLMNNGSTVKNCYGGAIFDYYHCFGKWKPYAGLMVGFAWSELYLHFNDPQRGSSLEPVDVAYYYKKMYFAVAPYIGCEYKILKKISLAVRADFVHGAGRDPRLPIGPRFYFGLVFEH